MTALFKTFDSITNSFFSRTDAWGKSVIDIARYVFEVLLMAYLSVRAAIFDQAQGLRTVIGVVSAQIYFTGWQAMPLMTVLALATGGICILQSSAQLQLLGGASMLGNLLVVIIVREVGPLLTALIVIARSGTAVASEIGNSRVNREIEALETMGINPLSYIVFPRIVGGVLSVLCLAFYFNIIALFGGFLVTRLLNDMPFSFYADSLANALTLEDVGLFLLKNGFSGMIIFVISCYQGLTVKQSSHEVPQVTTKAVVHSIIFVVSFNLIVTTLFYLNQLMKLGII
ncbi:MAG: ABC transporter permease [Bdellovibrionota bacterium]